MNLGIIEIIITIIYLIVFGVIVFILSLLLRFVKAIEIIAKTYSSQSKNNDKKE